ncbi:hypothetical protein [Flavobacterium sp. Root186]|uniref:hypothetical protein n=1 Tax=Flavobacterium sp. Root186 TaxID=1736485 RepID=UPI0006F68009|nr:hypothetical protein [Flavobacterium sp. Root186]KRB54073.1 hypothetical protein ASD98_20885 [Flavobacterium sp. Root186]
MTKNKFYALLMCFNAFISSAQMSGLHNTLKDSKLYGKVKSVSIYSIKKDENPEESNKILKDYFDEKGRLTQQDSYQNGNLDTSSKYYYDTNDSVVKYEHFYNSNNNTRKTIFFFNSKNLREKEINYSNDTIEDQFQYKYNEKNQQIEIAYFIYNNTLGNKSTKIYNSKGLLYKKTDFDDKNKIVAESTNKYNLQKQLIETHTVNFEEIDTKTLYTYDAMGNQNSTLALDKNQQMIYRLDFTYDKYGNLIKSIQKIKVGTRLLDITESLVYTLDDKNNWIKSIRTSKNKIGTKKRVIEYY